MNAGSLKALALVLATAFAFATFASAASATANHYTGKVGAKLKVTVTEPQRFTMTTLEGNGFICNTVKVSGELTEATGTSVTVEPSYENCFVEENGEQTNGFFVMETRGCHYTFQGLTTTGNPTGGEHANVELKCDTPGTSEPTGFTIKKTAFNLPCLLIPPQTIRHAVRYETVNESKTKVTLTAHGIVSKTEGAAGGFICPAGEHTDGSYTGSVTVEGAHLVENATP